MTDGIRLNIYLAGKISKNDWRHSIVNGLRSALDLNCGDELCDLPSEWPVLDRAIFGRHNYVGPFFIGCDHGCFHGANTHGTRGLHNQRDQQDAIRIADLCRKAIDKADLVFAWIESPDAYGTLIEIGYARGIGVPTAVAGPVPLQDLWLLGGFSVTPSDWLGWSENPKQPLMAAILVEIECKTWELNFERLESPIEIEFYKAIGPQEGMEVQFPIGPYRVDFAVPPKNVVIELDGHEFHKTREQRTHDAQRQRWLEANGWKVIRFTGSEIHKDADACAEEALMLINGNGGAS